MPILFVCHSMGDSNVITATAEALLKDAKDASDSLKFLLIGKAAEEKFKALKEDHSFKKNPAQVELIYLSDIVGSDTASALENGALTNAQLELIKPKLAGTTKALIGTPSQNSCIVPFQIAAYLADILDKDKGFIYNDYLFKEKGHAYWKTLAERSDWQNRYTWLLPLPYATGLAHSLNPEVSTETVGHPSIDSALSVSIDATKVAHIRTELEIAEGNALLFISGTKDLAQDQALLKALYETIASDAKYKNIAIRIGIHPGAAELPSYIENLQKQIPEALRAQVKLIITERIKSACAEVMQPELCTLKNINGDQAAQAADAVACAVPATLVNFAALQGKPGFYLQDQEPFINAGLFAGETYIHPFLDKIRTAGEPKPTTKIDLGLPSEQAIESIANKLR